MRNRTIREAWQEIKETTQCAPKAANDALSEFIKNHLDPSYILTKPIYDHYQALVQIAHSASEKIPSPYFEALRTLAIGAEFDIIRYSTGDVESSRWISSSNDLTVLLRPNTWQFTNPAITHDELIIVDVAKINSRSICEKFAFWAHELVHIGQYRTLGSFQFTKQYLVESRRGIAYENLTSEKEAQEIESLVLNFCQSTPAAENYLTGNGSLSALEDKVRKMARSRRAAIREELSQRRLTALSSAINSASGQVESYTLAARNFPHPFPGSIDVVNKRALLSTTRRLAINAVSIASERLNLVLALRTPEEVADLSNRLSTLKASIQKADAGVNAWFKALTREELRPSDGTRPR